MIPKIIHQTWKSRDIPEAFEPLRDTWLRHHPDWEYRLWTDDDCRAFIQAHHPDFLRIYDAYLTPICRVDAFRYFLMKYCGGLYVDMDFECLQALDPLLDGHGLVLGQEPQSHVIRHSHHTGGLPRLLCNAFMASEPGHPFWDHVIEALYRTCHEPGPLDATGPFFLTRAHADYADQDSLSILPTPCLYPLDAEESDQGYGLDLGHWIHMTRNAWAVHHWAGTWWRNEDIDLVLPVFRIQARLLSYGRHTAELHLYPRAFLPIGRPLVSCLMITRNRFAQALRAIDCFSRQTYEPRELVILDDDDGDDLERWCAEHKDQRIRHHRLASGDTPLGSLRNQAVALARGEYLCQWDDDDLYDPLRIEMQLSAIRALKTDACLLSRWTIWWPGQKRLATSNSRVWEGSLLCARTCLPHYPDQLRRGEDTVLTEALLKSARVALLDMPALYVYVRHDGSTFDAAHSDALWVAAEAQFEGRDYDRAMQQVGKRLDLDASLLAMGLPRHEPAEFDAAGQGFTHWDSLEGTADRPLFDKPQATGSTRVDANVPDLPAVLILIPIRGGARYLPGIFDRLLQLAYPHNKLSLGLLESDSNDDTWSVLQDLASRHHGAFRRIRCFKQDTGVHLSGPRWLPELQAKRRRIIAQCRNRLFQEAHQDETWTLWLDADVVDFPDDVLLRMLGCGKSILVPHCVQDPLGRSFDLNSFRYKPGGEILASRHRVDGLLQPPRGVGRFYLEDFRGRQLVEMDSVGGTMLLVESRIHKSGLLFPERPCEGYMETEGFAMLARNHGIPCWGMPDLEIRARGGQSKRGSGLTSNRRRNRKA